MLTLFKSQLKLQIFIIIVQIQFDLLNIENLYIQLLKNLYPSKIYHLFKVYRENTIEEI
jgi:hypothetical protein